MSSVARRTFLTGALTGATVVAFDPLSRGWVGVAEARESADPIPDLDGALITDPVTLATAADDYGHIVHRTPVAVLRPASIRDVVLMVGYANRHDIQVAMRGQGHTTFGQAQVRAGVVIDSSTLAAIHHVDRRAAVVGAGVLWHDLARAAIEHGMTPPVLLDYLELSVGGTLSVGGIGGATQHYGLQADNVLELEVVTGDGQLRRCSPSRNPELFNAVLGGLGQFGIIVRARIPLVPAPEKARGYQLFHSELGSYLTDQRRLLDDGRFNWLEGQVVRKADDSGWEFFVDAGAYYNGSRPDEAALLAGLNADPARTKVTDYDYFDWLNRLAPFIERQKQTGTWNFPHPRVNMFLPASRTQQVVADVLAEMTPADLGPGTVLFYPFSTRRLQRPFVEVPDEPVAFVFSMLRTAAPPTPDVVARMMGHNRLVYERARAVGGKQYPIGSIQLTQTDWRDHYGSDWPAFAAAKARYDPQRVLTPGPEIFATA